MTDKSPERWIVSLSVLVSWRNGRIEITSPLSGTIFQTDNPDVLRVIHAFAQARPIDDVVHKFAAYGKTSLCAFTN
jgi:hypothetical protein